jgi:hypothetical protein
MTGNHAGDTDRPLPPHPSEHMTPERFARWCASLEEEAAKRGLPPEPWPLPPA